MKETLFLLLRTSLWSRATLITIVIPHLCTAYKSSSFAPIHSIKHRLSFLLHVLSSQHCLSSIQASLKICFTPFELASFELRSTCLLFFLYYFYIHVFDVKNSFIFAKYKIDSWSLNQPTDIFFPSISVIQFGFPNHLLSRGLK